jgi:hypothetical protein
MAAALHVHGGVLARYFLTFPCHLEGSRAGGACREGPQQQSRGGTTHRLPGA